MLARNEKGEIISLMASQALEAINESGGAELSMAVWYVANDTDYKGRSVVKELGSTAMKEFLQKAHDQSRPVKAIIGEAQMASTIEDIMEEAKENGVKMTKKQAIEEQKNQERQEAQREKMFNRYAGMKRLYGKKKNGELFEVLYEAPPEDESANGDESHFMASMIDGSNSISKEDYMGLVRGIHGQYTRPEYFSSEYFIFLAQQEGQEINPQDVTSEAVEAYRQRYLKITEKIQKKLEKRLKPAQGDLIFLSERERRAEY